MLLSVGIQAVSGNPSSDPSLLPQTQIFPTLKTPSISLCPQPLKKGKLRPVRISASSSSLTQESSTLDGKNERNKGKEKLGVVVKPMERPRLVLKFIWMEKNIGIAIDQVIPGGHGTIPLSPYYFWPRKDAWEELKVMLESKPWISNKQMVVLLNQATDIINLWQQSGGDLA
ncbi:30S ribosomal protein 3, chloroplastic-like [Sesamum indicum]|uniref:30S ribosomal protein 3, chloroplastic n=1 Tax=Sesamum indicum TaxID=4182 RepID=A0A6I9U440_SESIN|nr:30S ribosomal protein 3, chloroplastic-like [Sesamum indicum]